MKACANHWALNCAQYVAETHPNAISMHVKPLCWVSSLADEQSQDVEALNDNNE